MTIGTSIEPQDITEQIIARARKDPQFKQALIADPRLALRQRFSIELPAGSEFTVLEETPNHSYFVLPAEPEAEHGAALTTDEFAQLAGSRPGQAGFGSQIVCPPPDSVWICCEPQFAPAGAARG